MMMALVSVVDGSSLALTRMLLSVLGLRVEKIGFLLVYLKCCSGGELFLSVG